MESFQIVNLTAFIASFLGAAIVVYLMIRNAKREVAKSLDESKKRYTNKNAYGDTHRPVTPKSYKGMETVERSVAA